jgi:hypothetical protein
VNNTAVTGNVDAWSIGTIADVVARNKRGGNPEWEYTGPGPALERIEDCPQYVETRRRGIRDVFPVPEGRSYPEQREVCAVIAASLMAFQPHERACLTACATDPSMARRRATQAVSHREATGPELLVSRYPVHDGVTKAVVPPSAVSEAAALRHVSEAMGRNATTMKFFLEKLVLSARRSRTSARSVIVAATLVEAYGIANVAAMLRTRSIDQQIDAMLRLASSIAQSIGIINFKYCTAAQLVSCISFCQAALSRNPDPLLSNLQTADLWCASSEAVEVFILMSLQRGSVLSSDIQADVDTCNSTRAASGFRAGLTAEVCEAVETISGIEQ